ncbi:MAG: tRNA (adenosine(37)-N6)-threonylcarbamoyltransferase complex dimerization subunit type 1 TsaB [Clostridia bacterium]|nr:tRNA (adenosine(37)-N6)-threonylcarbamoyltransferase complex dimerization subunit type 1 TsaB [Clostridia bacterium]
MKCLAIDTSGSHLTVALIDGKNVNSTFIDNCNLKHSVVLMPQIENLLNSLNVMLNEIDVFACSVGPGSFTGIRIGVSVVKAFAYANNKKVLSVTSFDALAYNSLSGNNLAVIDARHDNYYVQKYNGVTPIGEPAFISGEELKKVSCNLDGVLSFENSQTLVKNADIKEGFINAVIDKLSSATFDVESINPLYVRKSQAEENL